LGVSVTERGPDQRVAQKRPRSSGTSVHQHKRRRALVLPPPSAVHGQFEPAASRLSATGAGAGTETDPVSTVLPGHRSPEAFIDGLSGLARRLGEWSQISMIASTSLSPALK
jgi:hypothetical protein